MSLHPWASIGRIAEVVGWPISRIRNIAERAGRFYRPFDLIITGKKRRHIDNPTGNLRALQKLVAKRILSKLTFPLFLFGSIRGRSAIDMAQLHAGQPCIVAVDISACFPSTKASLVRSSLVERGGFGRQSAALITQLATLHDGLPQGAPTSSHLLNLAMLAVHQRLHSEAQKRGLVYTVFVDDIVISGKEPEAMIDLVVKELRKIGYAISHKKKRIMRGANREVLGLRISEKIDANSEFYKRFNMIIAKAIETNSLSRRESGKLKGMLNYLRAVNPELSESLASVSHMLLCAIPSPEAEPPSSEARVRLPCKHRRKHRKFFADAHAVIQESSQACP